jgi:hypothetical protein
LNNAPSWAKSKRFIPNWDYREFQATYDYTSNISFGVWGYDYNNYYNSIRFGLCISTNKVEEFIAKLRLLLNK